jgi:cytochrome c biogenesis protein CcmG, thiol:disulfide interchange protein DsbE
MNARRAVLATAFTVPLIALLAFGLTRDPKAINSPLPGRRAPDLALEVFAEGVGDSRQPAGDTIRLSELRGQVVVLNFWGSWCYQCRLEHTALSAVAEEYVAKGVRFYGVLYNDSRSSARRWIEEMGGQSYPSIDDPRTRTAIDYGVYGAPETFFIGRDGVIASKFIGPITHGELRRRLDGLLAARAAPDVGLGSR